MMPGGAWVAPLALAAFLAAGTGGHAATITSDTAADGTVAITVEGELFEGDGGRFETLAAPFSHAVVLLSGPGGNLLAGISIGAVARQTRYATVVESGHTCASACAFAWLGGVPRLAGEAARIGLHAAYVFDKDGTPHETGAGNALLGAYLDRLALSFRAIAYATQAAPRSMTWLSEDDAQRLGIRMTVLRDEAGDGTPIRRDVPAAPQSVLSPPNDAALERLYPVDPVALVAAGASVDERRAAAAVLRLLAIWSSRNDESARLLPLLYAGTIDFYGAQTPRERVMQKKARFMERWAERYFAVRPGSGGVRCAQRQCLVTGTLDWSCASAARTARSAGAATFAYVVDASGLISGERGAVLQNAAGPLRHDPDTASAATAK